jgi:hypothetical protein
MNHPIRTLDEALAGLATQREPDRDLWPGIARAIGQAERPGALPVALPDASLPTRRPLALAASLAVLGLAGSLAWNLRSLPPAPQGAALPLAAGAQAIAARFAPPDDAAYQAARTELERTFNERLELLAPATRTRIQADLATIRAANADIRKALGDDPASPLLLQLLASTWQQEIDLYTNVARATNPMIHRSTRT